MPLHAPGGCEGRRLQRISVLTLTMGRSWPFSWCRRIGAAACMQCPHLSGATLPEWPSETSPMSAADVAGPWPKTEDELVTVQRRLAALTPDPWHLPPVPYSIGACFVCFPKGFVGPGGSGDRAWAAAVVMTAGTLDAHAAREGTAPAAYRSGFLALREGPLLEEAIRALPLPFEVLLVDASGRDHPRGAGLALHLGARLGVPTIGVTNRPLVAQGEWPPDQQGAVSPVRVDQEIVGYWVRTVQRARPLVVHAAWRTDAETAVRVVLGALGGRRTPEPLRLARQSARAARAQKR